ncbi:MAG: protein kinase [Pyrinomonadaceae bacterium]
MIEDIVGKLVADKYRIESLIREGSAGDLFAGKHEISDKPVTIMILPQALSIDARWSKKFIDAARSASSVSHANILNVTDFGTDAKGVSYAVFEPASGETLSGLLADGGAIDEKRALTFTHQIATGVAAAHEKKIIHAALAPANVFVENDTAKVYGFGGDPLDVAKSADPRYLAPEQSNAYPVADERSDIYSLGIVLYEMLTGVVPYDAATAADVAKKQTAEPAPPLSTFRRDLHPDIEPILLSAIALDPERRYQTMTAFAEDLEMLTTGKVKAAAATAGTSKHNIWQTAFIALAGITLLAAALIYFTSVRKTDPTAQLTADAGSLPVQPIGPATGAQEESLAKLPEMTEAEIMAASAGMMEVPPGTLPGGDGYNAWSGNGAPPIGAPAQGVPPTGMPQPDTPPGGQTVTVNSNGDSQFMPVENGSVILVPVPAGNSNTGTIPPAGNTVTKPSSTPKPMATPVPKAPKTTGKPADTKKSGTDGAPDDVQ